MKALVLIAASGSDDDLVDLAAASVRRQGAKVAILGGPESHGRKLDMGRIGLDTQAVDIVICMDSDVVVFPGWLEWIERTLADPLISACGAPRIDGARGLHPSMLAMRIELYLKAPSFVPVDGKDTGVAVSDWLEQRGYLQGAKEYRGDWWTYSAETDGVQKALWWHLGSGSASVWPGLVKLTYRFIRAQMGSREYQKSLDRYLRRRRFIETARRALAQ